MDYFRRLFVQNGAEIGDCLEWRFQIFHFCCCIFLFSLRSTNFFLMAKNRLAQKWTEAFPNDSLTLQVQGIYCHACSKLVPASIFNHVRQHIESGKHKANLALHLKKGQPVQQFLGNQPRDQFSMELCAALVGANIPLKKVQKPAFKNFLEKWCGKTVPDRSNSERNYLKVNYEQV